MNIQAAPITYSDLSTAYLTIRSQYHRDYVCCVKDIEVNDTKTFYIDVRHKDTGDFIGYLGKHHG